MSPDAGSPIALVPSAHSSHCSASGVVRSASTLDAIVRTNPVIDWLLRKVTNHSGLCDDQATQGENGNSHLDVKMKGLISYLSLRQVLLNLLLYSCACIMGKIDTTNPAKTILQEEQDPCKKTDILCPLFLHVQDLARVCWCKIALQDLPAIIGHLACTILHDSLTGTGFCFLVHGAHAHQTNSIWTVYCATGGYIV